MESSYRQMTEQLSVIGIQFFKIQILYLKYDLVVSIVYNLLHTFF